MSIFKDIGDMKSKVPFLLLCCLSNFVYAQYNVPYSGSNQIHICSGTLYEYNGTGNYGDNANGYTVIYPSAGNAVRIVGTSSSGEACCDYVDVWDGVGLTTLLGRYYMGTAIPTLTSTKGPLTIRFVSDYSVTGAGFSATVSCVALCSPTLTLSAPNATASPTTVCSGGSVTLTSNGNVPGGQGSNSSGVLSITAQNQYVQIASNGAQQVAANTDFTYEMWVKPTSFAANNNTYFENGQWNGQTFLFRQNSPTDIHLYINGTDRGGIPYAPELNVWTHLALVRSGGAAGTLTLYANGCSVGTFSAYAAAINPVAVMRIGCSVHTTGQTFIGAIDEFRFWKGVAVSTANLNSWRYRQVDNTHANWANLSFCYRFNGNYVNSGSGTSPTGTNVGTAFAAANWYTFTWTGSGAPGASTNEVQTATATAPGTYSVVASRSEYTNSSNGVTANVTVNPNHTITAGTNRTVCTGVLMTSFTMTIGGGATNFTASGLPPGINASLSGSTITVSGTPTTAGTYNYTITTTGNSCPAQQATGTITVNASHGITTGSNRTVCIHNPMTSFTVTLSGGATGVTSSNLPPGVSASVSGTTVTVSGTPTTAGVYNYTLTTTGTACTAVTATGTITVHDIASSYTASYATTGASQNITMTGNGNQMGNTTGFRVDFTPTSGSMRLCANWGTPNTMRIIRLGVSAATCASLPLAGEVTFNPSVAETNLGGGNICYTGIVPFEQVCNSDACGSYVTTNVDVRLRLQIRRVSDNGAVPVLRYGSGLAVRVSVPIYVMAYIEIKAPSGGLYYYSTSSIGGANIVANSSWHAAIPFFDNVKKNPSMRICTSFIYDQQGAGLASGGAGFVVFTGINPTASASPNPYCLTAPAQTLSLTGGIGTLLTTCESLSHEWRTSTASPATFAGSQIATSQNPTGLTPTTNTYHYIVSSATQNVCYGTNSVSITDGAGNPTTWTGNGITTNNNWYDHANWSNCVPTITVDAIINDVPANRPSINSPGATAKSLKINNANPNKLTLTSACVGSTSPPCIKLIAP